MTLVAGVLVIICVCVIITSVFIAGKYHHSPAVAAPVSGCHDNDMTQDRAHRQEMRLGFYFKRNCTTISRLSKSDSYFESAYEVAAVVYGSCGLPEYLSIGVHYRLIVVNFVI